MRTGNPRSAASRSVGEAELPPSKSRNVRDVAIGGGYYQYSSY